MNSLRSSAAILGMIGLVGLRDSAAEERKEWPVLIRARTEVAVPARAAGVVVERAVARSSRVQAGQVILRLDSVLPQHELARATAVLSRAEAESTWTSAELERERRLSESGSGSVSNLERLTAEAKVREAGVALARAELAIAREHLQRAEVRAPIDGLLVDLYPEQGEMVQLGSTVARVLSDRDLVAETFVPSDDLVRLRLGEDYTMRTTDGTAVAANLTEITRAAGPERCFRVWFSLKDPPDSVHAGSDGRISAGGFGR